LNSICNIIRMDAQDFQEKNRMKNQDYNSASKVCKVNFCITDAQNSALDKIHCSMATFHSITNYNNLSVNRFVAYST